MAFITGLLIPATVIDASAQEFIDVMNPVNPVIFIVNAMLLSFGSFVLWGGVFYFFMSDKAKNAFSAVRELNVDVESVTDSCRYSLLIRSHSRLSICQVRESSSDANGAPPKTMQP